MRGKGASTEASNRRFVASDRECGELGGKNLAAVGIGNFFV